MTGEGGIPATRSRVTYVSVSSCCALLRQVVYKLPTQSSWCFDVQWCPRNPPAFSAVSFDGWISLYSVMGRSWEAQHMRQADKV